MQLFKNNQHSWFFCIVLACIIYIISFQIPVMDVDSAQYASMSGYMLRTGHYLQVYDFGRDYLDKPPFLFWVNAFFMRFFGVNNFSFRLPSFLFALLAIYATYQFSLLFYTKKIAQLSAMVLACSQALFLVAHDVRTDTILMSWVIVSIWLLAAWFEKKKWYYFVGGFLSIGCGMVTKGPIALIVPIVAFGTHFILRRELLKKILDIRYVGGVLLIAIVLLPMSYGLYKQFDIHPEKLVNGKYHVSGLRFFFWTQSFGRITGESEWDNHANIFFLIQNMLWSFLPWIIFFVCGVVKNIGYWIKNKFRITTKEEGITLGGFIFTYICLGLSRYQLPHYIFVVFPFAAIITAKFIYALLYTKTYPRVIEKTLCWIHAIIFFILWDILLIIISWSLVASSFMFFISIALAFGYVCIWVWRGMKRRLMILCVYSILGINFVLATSFYPHLLKYEIGSQVGLWVKSHHISKDQFFRYKGTGPFHSLDFYAQEIVPAIDSINQSKPGDYILLWKSQLHYVIESHRDFQVVMQGEDFSVTLLNFNFIKPETRYKETTPYLLIKMIQ